MFGRGTAPRRIAVILVLLAAAFGLSALLAWRVISVERRRLAAADRVVRDYAAVVADDLLRRIVYEVEEFHLDPVRFALVTSLRREGTLPTPGDLSRWPGQLVRRTAPNIDQTFVVDFEQGSVRPSLAPALQRWVLTEMEQAIRQRQNGGRHAQVRARIEGREHWLSYASTPVQGRTHAGFIVRPDLLGSAALRALNRRSPFPGEFEGRRRLQRPDLSIHLYRGDVQYLRSDPPFDPARGVRLQVPSSFGDFLGGSAMEISFAPSAIGAILPGGLLPGNNITFALATLLILLLVLVAAAMLVREERRLAAMRADFISGISHELRTPLTQIRMFSETLLLNRVRSERERKRSLEIINHETSRLTHLVENLLLLSRRERGVVQLVFERTDLHELIGATIETFEPLMATRHSTIRLTGGPGLVVPVDRNALKQVLINILDNAVKYGPPRQTIQISLGVAGSMARILVDDEGPGIPLQEREAIWQRFYRLGRDRETHKAGSGIGLAVVADIVARHGGRCSAGVAPSGGARFIIEFPLLRSHEGVEPEHREGRLVSNLGPITRH